MNFLRKWGMYILLSLVCIVALIMYIISECTTGNDFLRIIYGIVTMLPVGAMIPYLIREGIEKFKGVK